jgi:hypothetical protein
MRTYTVGEFEDGFWVERADRKDIEKMVQVKGPFHTPEEADAAALEIEAICAEARRAGTNGARR